MMRWTDRARARFEQYLDEVRASLADNADIDPGEVIAELRDHVEMELADREQPVDLEHVEHVLENLGEPARWTPQSPARPAPPLEVATSAAAMLLLVAALLFEPLLLPVAYLVSRFRADRAPLSNAEKWLAFPPLAVGAAAAIALLLFWPLGLAMSFGGPGGFAEELPGVLQRLPPEGTPGWWAGIYGVAAIVAGLWWLAIGLKAGLLKRIVGWLTRPLLRSAALEPRRPLAIAGAASIAIGAAALLLVP